MVAICDLEKKSHIYYDALQLLQLLQLKTKIPKKSKLNSIFIYYINIEFILGFANPKKQL